MRNISLEEKCNLKYSVALSDDGGISTQVRAAINASRVYCLVFPSMINAATMASSAMLKDFQSFEKINLDGEWWDQGTRDLKLADGIYFMNSEVSFLAKDVTYLMLFSKKLVTENNLGSLYDLVTNNEWTIDKMISLSDGIAKDLNGDSIRDNKDRYGLVTTDAYANTFFYGSELKFVECPDGQNPKLAMSETDLMKASDLLQKVLTLYNAGQSVFVNKSGAEQVGMNMFAAGQSLFYGEVASYIVNLRTMEEDFGVLPVPKYDTNQDYYKTWVHSIASTMCIPISVATDDLETLGEIIEAMALYSYEYVQPAYYTITLQTKTVRDEESAAMLDIIFAHRVYDICQYYSSLGLSDVFSSCCNSVGGNFSSKYKAGSTKFEKSVKTLLKKLNATKTAS